MSRDVPELLPGALLISDAHYSAAQRPELLPLLRGIDEGRVKATQLILMGDIFDLLVGQVPYSHRVNDDALQTLQRISARIPMLYLEGNHDYNLTALFPDADIFALKHQPVTCRFGAQRVRLAHGDFNQPRLYRLYVSLIRNPGVLYFLRFIDFFLRGTIIRKLETYLQGKNNCYAMQGFEAFVQRHLASTPLTPGECFIEGHYHQGRSFALDGATYINLPAFACARQYGVLQSTSELSLEYRTWNG